ncbi:MAG: hypothetical protein LRZ85_03930 [Alphaproteobacteria bacterium]|nr:hypothetical protein [Alphaproteobacteria bacterium]MCD8571652.1 hypothetical protein [Alphaproteobacteria bacterium]
MNTGSRWYVVKIRVLLACFVFVAGLVINAAPAQACCTCLSVTQPTSFREWFTTFKTVDDITKTYNQSMTAHEGWIVSYMFDGQILPAMQMMATQLSAVMMQQVQILGSFFDAKQQLETQRVFQRLQAEAHRDYHPSNGLCEFGSAVRSLASSERRGEFNMVALSQRSLDRSLGNNKTSAREGPQYDWETRLGQFRSAYCDPEDNNTLMKEICTSPGDPARYNRDVNYASTLDYPLTLKVNFTDGDLKRDEQDVFALASNLYGNEIFLRPPPGVLKADDTKQLVPPIVKNYMDARALLAKQGVAENSYNAIVGMKAESPDSGAGSKKYLQEMIRELGVEKDEDIQEMLGENPSYYAQMEVLTKRIFENPLFYTNLYDKTANVARKDVALKALSLMQKFDTFKSSLRTEANLSVLLEIATMETEKNIADRMADTSSKGPSADAASGGGGATP